MNAPANTSGRRTVNLTALGEGGSPVSLSDRLARARHDSYTAENPAPSALNLKGAGSVSAAILKLDVTQVQLFDKNPRRFHNENYEDIAASMEAQGQTQPLPVTQREPNGPYIISAGGNTRLEWMKRRFEQTKDPEHRYAYFYYTPYRDEAQLIAQHLTENLSRGEMKFWECAVGVVDLIKLLKEQEGQNLTLRDLEEKLRTKGLRLGRTMLSRYTFAVDRLHSLGPALEALTGLSVSETFMPRLNLAAKLASKFGVDEETSWATLFTPALERAGQAYLTASEKVLPASEICDSCEVALADKIGHSVHEVRTMLGVLRKGDQTLLDLKAAIASASHGSSFVQADGRQEDGAERSEAPAQASKPQRPSEVQAHQPARPQAPTTTVTHSVHTVDKTPGALPHDEIQAVSQATASTAANLQERFKQELTVLCDLAGIADLLVWRDQLPLGFFIDYPTPGDSRHAISTVSSNDQVGLIARTSKSVVFWSLMRLSGQSDPENAGALDPTSNFYRAMADENFDNQWMEGLDMGTTLRDDDVLVLATKPEYPAIGWLMKVIYTIRELNTKN
ncbi:hypothetical protein JY96_21510 [Aquabacterium sp. NJ1]|uniref:hypothetical protein n=1 Tax=Aquabacterium sp. NJ1 TaxID=1538295 RepID=UPI00052C8F92|nr:hypothetical protein [Aquabacterium sp. NJ1]KGM38743.1 hypothetical protein JY96_21510 [Aquabacterium sp. NJ1]